MLAYVKEKYITIVSVSQVVVWYFCYSGQLQINVLLTFSFLELSFHQYAIQRPIFVEPYIQLKL